jgi:hypothetical protein
MTQTLKKPAPLVTRCRLLVAGRWHSAGIYFGTEILTGWLEAPCDVKYLSNGAATLHLRPADEVKQSDRTRRANLRLLRA